MEQSLKLIKTQQEVATKLYHFLSQLMEKELLRFNGIEMADIENYDEEYIETIKNNPHVALAGGAPRDWFLDKPARDMDMYILTQNFDAFFKELHGTFYPKKWYAERNGISGMTSFMQPKPLVRDYFASGCENRSPVMVWIGDKLIEQGYTFTKLIDKTYDGNGYNNPFISSVFELDMDGQTFDLIFMSGDKSGSFYVEETNEFVYQKPLYFLYKVQLDANTGKEEVELVRSFNEFVISTYDFQVCKAYWDFESKVIMYSPAFIKDIEEKTLTILHGFDKNLLHNSIFKHFKKLQNKFPDFKFNPVKEK